MTSWDDVQLLRLSRSRISLESNVCWRKNVALRHRHQQWSWSDMVDMMRRVVASEKLDTEYEGQSW